MYGQTCEMTTTNTQRIDLFINSFKEKIRTVSEGKVFAAHRLRNTELLKYTISED